MARAKEGGGRRRPDSWTTPNAGQSHVPSRSDRRAKDNDTPASRQRDAMHPREQPPSARDVVALLGSIFAEPKRVLRLVRRWFETPLYRMDACPRAREAMRQLLRRQRGLGSEHARYRREFHQTQQQQQQPHQQDRGQPLDLQETSPPVTGARTPRPRHVSDPQSPPPSRESAVPRGEDDDPMLFVDATSPGVFYRYLRDVFCSPVQLSIDTDALYIFPHCGFNVTLVDMTPAERVTFRALFDAGRRLFGSHKYLLFTAHMSQCTLDDGVARLASRPDDDAAVVMATMRSNMATAMHALVMDNVARLWRRPWAQRLLRVFRDVYWHQQHRGLLAALIAPTATRAQTRRKGRDTRGESTVAERALVAATKRECCVRLLWAYQCQLQRLVADLEGTAPEKWIRDSRQSDAGRLLALSLLRIMDAETADRVRVYAGWDRRRTRK